MIDVNGGPDQSCDSNDKACVAAPETADRKKGQRKPTARDFAHLSLSSFAVIRFGAKRTLKGWRARQNSGLGLAVAGRRGSRNMGC